MQNFAPGGAGVPQLGHVRSSAFPHDMQNFAEAGFSVPQLAAGLRRHALQDTACRSRSTVLLARSRGRRVQ